MQQIFDLSRIRRQHVRPAIVLAGMFSSCTTVVGTNAVAIDGEDISGNACLWCPHSEVGRGGILVVVDRRRVLRSVKIHGIMSPLLELKARLARVDGASESFSLKRKRLQP